MLEARSFVAHGTLGDSSWTKGHIGSRAADSILAPPCTVYSDVLLTSNQTLVHCVLWPEHNVTAFSTL